VNSPFRPREKFLILELTSSGTNGLFLSVDEDKNIIIEKLTKQIDLKKFFNAPMRRVTQKSWEGEYFFKSHRKVIAVADADIATTIPVPLTLDREPGTAEEPISLPEIENMIAQAMGKIFNQCRTEAAGRLGIDELDTVLVGAKAKHFKVGKHLVVSPVGFTGKTVSLFLELTLTSRATFEGLQQFFSAPEDFFFGEAPQIRLSSLARARKLPINVVAPVGDGSALFVLEKTKDEYPVLYREKFAWSFQPIFRRIAARMGISETAARDVYELYARNGMSEAAARVFKKMIEPVVEELFSEIEKGKLKGFVYVESPHALPFELPHKRNGVVFDALPIDEIVQNLGFAEIHGRALPPNVLSHYLLPFIEAYFDKTKSDVNQKLRRRLHWLTK
jgi:hypothetical protein